MKPPSFEYSRASTLDEALAMLGELGGEAKVLAGGQSLMPLLSMRLAAPRHLVDINRLSELAYVRTSADGVRVGATARHADLERDPDAAGVQPLLRRAVRLIAHPTIRNRGTVVGSLAHADPAAELPAVLMLVDGEVELVAATGGRTVPAADFFVGPLESALRAGELAVAARFPAAPPGTGTAWLEVSRRAGDYALCGLGIAVTLDDDRRVSRARAAYVSVGPTPVLVDLAEAVAGRPFDAADWSGAGALAAGRVEPEDDIHATAGYRRHLTAVLTARAGAAAARHAATRHRAMIQP